MMFWWRQKNIKFKCQKEGKDFSTSSFKRYLKRIKICTKLLDEIYESRHWSWWLKREVQVHSNIKITWSIGHWFKRKWSCCKGIPLKFIVCISLDAQKIIHLFISNVSKHPCIHTLHAKSFGKLFLKLHSSVTGYALLVTGYRFKFYCFFENWWR